MKRRDFVNSCAVDSMAAAIRPARAAERIAGANRRVRIGWIGCGGRGTFVARCFQEAPDAEIMAGVAADAAKRAAASGPPLVLVERGQPRAEIVVAGRRPRMATLAALELRHFLHQTSPV